MDDVKMLMLFIYVTCESYLIFFPPPNFSKKVISYFLSDVRFYQNFNTTVVSAKPDLDFKYRWQLSGYPTIVAFFLVFYIINLQFRVLGFFFAPRNFFFCFCSCVTMHVMSDNVCFRDVVLFNVFFSFAGKWCCSVQCRRVAAATLVCDRLKSRKNKENISTYFDDHRIFNLDKIVCCCCGLLRTSIVT